MVAYPAKLKLPYRVGNSWLEERTLAGEIVIADHSLEIDLDQLDEPHRAAAIALAKTLDENKNAFSARARTPVIVGSAIDPDAQVEKDLMDAPILRAIGRKPQLPSPVEDPAVLVDAWNKWVADYKRLAPAALSAFIARYADDEADGDETGKLKNGAHTGWWRSTIWIIRNGRNVKFSVDARNAPDLFVRVRGAAQLLEHAKSTVEQSDWSLAVGIVGQAPAVLEEEPEAVVARYEAFAERIANLAFARYWTGQRHRAGFEQEMVRWANEHGSERLRFGLQDGYRMMPVYLQERIAREVPGFYAHLPGRDDARLWQPRTGPSAEALKLRRAVQERLRTSSPYAGEIPQVQIGWIKDPPAQMCDMDVRTVCDHWGNEVEVREDPFEVLVVPDWLGRYVLIAAVWTAQEDQPPNYVLLKHVVEPSEYGLGDLPSPPKGETLATANFASASAPADDDIPF